MSEKLTPRSDERNDLAKLEAQLKRKRAEVEAKENFGKYDVTVPAEGEDTYNSYMEARSGEGIVPEGTLPEGVAAGSDKDNRKYRNATDGQYASVEGYLAGKESEGVYFNPDAHRVSTQDSEARPGEDGYYKRQFDRQFKDELAYEDMSLIRLAEELGEHEGDRSISNEIVHVMDEKINAYANKYGEMVAEQKGWSDEEKQEHIKKIVAAHTDKLLDVADRATRRTSDVDEAYTTAQSEAARREWRQLRVAQRKERERQAVLGGTEEGAPAPGQTDEGTPTGGEAGDARVAGPSSDDEAPRPKMPPRREAPQPAPSTEGAPVPAGESGANVTSWIPTPFSNPSQGSEGAPAPSAGENPDDAPRDAADRRAAGAAPGTSYGGEGDPAARLGSPSEGHTPDDDDILGLRFGSRERRRGKRGRRMLMKIGGAALVGLAALGVGAGVAKWAAAHDDNPEKVSPKSDSVAAAGPTESMLERHDVIRAKIDTANAHVAELERPLNGADEAAKGEGWLNQLQEMGVPASERPALLKKIRNSDNPAIKKWTYVMKDGNPGIAQPGKFDRNVLESVQALRNIK